MKTAFLWTLLALFLSLGLVAVSCDDDDDDNNDDNNDDDTAACTQQTLCEYALECGYVTTVEECLISASESCADLDAQTECSCACLDQYEACSTDAYDCSRVCFETYC